jgi:hypothetical protein
MEMVDLTFQELREIRERTGGMSKDHPTASFVISRVCDTFLNEYEDQGIPIGRDRQIQGMAALLEAVLQSPADLSRLDDLVRYANDILAHRQ